MTLVSAQELGALRAVAESGMTTPASVYRRSVVTDANGQHSTWALQGTILGWMFSEPTPVITLNAGEQALVNTYRWFCPVGTDIISGDKLLVGAAEFTVSDTNTESTYLPLLRCSLRRAE
jgi:hypothetical protein